MNTNSIDIKNTNFTHRDEPKYSSSEVVLNFENEDAFNTYRNNIINKHATWCYFKTNLSKKKYNDNDAYIKHASLLVSTVYYRCDHAGAPKKQKGTVFLVVLLHIFDA